jgi:hypothetical protein
VKLGRIRQHAVQIEEDAIVSAESLVHPEIIPKRPAHRVVTFLA